MIFLIDISVKVAIILLLALGCVAVMRGRSAALRHWVLAAAVACALIAPVLTRLVPSWTLHLALPVRSGTTEIAVVSPATSSIIPQNGAAEYAAEPADATVKGAALLNLDLWRWLALVWAIGAVWTGSLLIVGLTRMTRIAARAQPVTSGPWLHHAAEMGRVAGIRRAVTLLRSDHPTLLVTWGWPQPKVVLPAVARGWSEDCVRIVLRHEFAHIGRGDWVAQMTGELLRTIYWFNPLVWIACRRLRRE